MLIRHERERVLRRLADRFARTRAIDHPLVGVDEVRIQVNTEVAVKLNTAGTSWRALVPDSMPRFEVRPRGLTTGIAKLFGAQDIELGDLAFDRAFVVKGDDPPLIRSLWTARCRELMAPRFEDALIERDKGLMLYEAWQSDEVAHLVAGVELIAALVDSDLFGLEALKTIGGRLDLGERPYVAVSGPGDIQIGVAVTEGGTVSQASCPAGTEEGTLASERAAAIGAQLTRDGDRWCVTWPGVEKRTAALVAAVDLLRDLSRGPSDGAYR